MSIFTEQTVLAGSLVITLQRNNLGHGASERLLQGAQRFPIPMNNSG